MLLACLQLVAHRVGTPPGLVNTACLFEERDADILIAKETVLLNPLTTRMRYQMDGSLLLCLGESLMIEQVSQEERHVIVSVRSTAPPSRCPLCAAPSESIHSHYLRTVADLPCAGQLVVLKQDICQNLKMGLLPSAFSLMWGSAFGATIHDASMTMLIALS
jgi:hypothetical protein